MKKLAAQALAFQYQLQIENAQAVLNNSNAALNLIDQSLVTERVAYFLVL